MKFKNVMIMSLIMLIFLTISAAAASDDNITSDEVALEDNVEDVQLESVDEEIVSQDMEEESSNDDLLEIDSGGEEVIGEPTSNLTMTVTAGDCNYGEIALVIVEAEQKDVTGNVSVMVDGSSYSQEFSSGMAVFNVSGLSPGIYNVTVDYPGDGTYFPSSAFTTLTVNKAKATVDVMVIPGVRHADVRVVVTPEEAEGFVFIYLDGELRGNRSTNSSFSFDKLSAGDHTLDVIYSGDDYYNSTNCSTEFAVSKEITTIDITVAEVNYYGDDVEIEVRIPSDATGGVSMSVGGAVYPITIIDGVGSTVISSLEVGDYLVRVNYAGDHDFTATINETSFRVIQNSFSQLQDRIDAAYDSITLDRDYYGNATPITISKDNFAIDGNGHLLDAQHFSRIFNIQANGVILRNLILQNASSDGLGGAIYVGNSYYNFQVFNTSFINCSANYGGGIYIEGNDAILDNVIFMECSASNYGGALCWYGNNGFVNSSKFNYCGADYNGGAIFWHGDDGIMFSCNFAANHAKDNGGAVCIDGSNTVILDSIFTENYAYNGGAAYGQGFVEYSNFTNNFASRGSAIYNCNYTNCSFSLNSEPEIYFDEEYRKSPTITVEIEDIMVGDILTVTVTISDNLSVPIIVLIGDMVFNLTSVNGTVALNIAELPAGSYIANVLFMGTYEYSNGNVSKMFNVSKHDVILNIAVDDIVYGQKPVVDIALSEPVFGNVSITVKPVGGYGATYDTTIENGTGSFTISSYQLLDTLPAGEYNVVANFKGNECYGPANATINFMVGKASPSFSMSAENVNAGENITVFIRSTINETCNAPVFFGAKAFQVTLVGGNATLTIPSGAPGDYEIFLMFDGDDNYNPSNATCNVSVAKLNCSVMISVEGEYNDENITLNVTLPEDATGTVSVQVNGVEYPPFNLTSGEGHITFHLEEGSYSFNIIYNGDTTYNPTNKWIMHTVRDAFSFETLNNLIYDAEDVLALEKDYVGDGYGILINRTITIDGNNHVLDARGLSSILGVMGPNVVIKNLKLINASSNYPGGAVYWSGNNGQLINCEFENNYADNSGAAVFWEGNDGLINSCNFTANLATGNGGAVYVAGSNTVISESIFSGNSAGNGGAVYVAGSNTVISESSFTGNSAENGGAVFGVALVSFSYFANNDATLGGAIYNGNCNSCSFSLNSEPEIYFDEEYRKSTPITVNVSNIAVGENLTLEVSLPNGVSGVIHVTDLYDNLLKVANITGHVAVDLSGVPAGNHTLKVTFNGNSEYLANSTTVSFTVFKAPGIINSIIVPTENTTVGQNVTVTVNMPYSNAIVQVEVGEHNFTIKTDSEGVAVLNIPLPAGSYTAAAYFLGDMDHTPYALMNETVFNVVKRNSLVSINFSGENVYIVGSAFNITIANNTAAEVTIAGKAYNIDPATGNVIINTSSLAGGEYMVIATINENSEYYGNQSIGWFTILKKNLSVNFTVSDIYVGDDEVMEIMFNESFNGTVTIRIKPATQNSNLPISNENTTSGPVPRYDVDIINGYGSRTILDLAAKKYNATLSFSGNDNYAGLERSLNFTVSMRQAVINVSYNSTEGFMNITLPADGGGATLYILDYSWNIAAGGRMVDLRNLPAGNHTYTLSYNGNGRYVSSMSYGIIFVDKKASEINVDVSDAEYGQTQNIHASVPGNATSNVTFILLKDGVVISNTTAQVSNGVANYEISNLKVGTYTLKACYNGDSNYYQSSFFEKTFKILPNIAITPQVSIGEDGIITIEFGDVSGTVSISVDDEEDGSKKIREGKFIYALSTWALSTGYHNITFGYEGSDLDENVFNEWDNQTMQYRPIKYSIYISRMHTITSPESDNDKVLEVAVKDEEGNVLSDANGTVEFTIINQVTKEVTVLVVEIVKGIANLDISKYRDGNYLINWKYSGDEIHAPISRQMTLNIAHRVSKITATDFRVLYSSAKTYSVTVYEANGKTVRGANVQFLIKNKVFATATSNANGVASIVISNAPGSYKVTIRALGFATTRNLKVDHVLTLKKFKVKRSAKKLVIQATLKKVNGKYLKAKKITLKFNGKKLTAKTNKKGVAKFTVKAKVLKKLKAGKKVKYQATYLKDTVKMSVKVSK